MFNLNRRVKKLEEEIKRLEIRQNCEKGIHDWELRKDDQKPFIKCPHCWAAPKGLKYVD